MKKTVINFGLLSGLIIIVYTTVIFLVFGDFSKMKTEDFSKLEMLGYLRYIILLLTIIFAIRYFKKQNGNTANFRQLFLAGLYTALVVALLVGLMEMAYMLINPDFMDQYAELTTRKMQEEGATTAAIASHKADMDKYKWMANPALMGIFYFFETAILGTLISLVVSLILKTRMPNARRTSNMV